MKIYIIGKTEAFLFPDAIPDGAMPGKASGSAFQDRVDDESRRFWELPNPAPEGQELIEFAGRLCYESWDLPNENTATNDKYIRNIVNQGHESVLEHVSVTFYVEGVSRNLSHELIRHRHLSFSELSQRFVDMSDADWILPPAMAEAGPREVWQDVDLAADAAAMYSETVDELQGAGKTRKQAREAARAILPSGMETKFVVTGNLRAWRDVLKKRDSEHADAEMQLFAKEIKRQLLQEYPDVFRDLNEGS